MSNPVPTITRITVNTAGACPGNSAPGGWAAIIIGWNDNEMAFRQQINGEEGDPTTNQKMELMAAIKALAWIKDQGSFDPTVPILVRSNSRHAHSALA